MSFHDIRFPTRLSFGSLGGPERRTSIVSLANGFEERSSPWAHSRRRYDAGLGLRSLQDIEVVIAFFEARHGQLYGFRWKDWADYRSCGANGTVGPLDQDLGDGDGQQLIFGLSKTYRSGLQSYRRPITKPVQGSVQVAVGGILKREGEDYQLDYLSGLISFLRPPEAKASVTAGFEFDVPVRFDSEQVMVSVASFNAGEVPSVPVVELRQ